MKTFTPMRIVALVSAVLVVVSMCLPWGKLEGVTMVRGFEGDGLITGGLAVIAIILLLIKQVPRWISLILGAGIVATSIFTYTNIASLVDLDGVTVGSGVYGTIVFGAVMVLSIIASLFIDKKAQPLQ